VIAAKIVFAMRATMPLLFSMTFVLTKPTDAEVRKEIRAMEAASKKISASKKTARAFLLTNGFITKDNKLGKAYR
jgi:hypothetical protein